MKTISLKPRYWKKPRHLRFPGGWKVTVTLGEDGHASFCAYPPRSTTPTFGRTVQSALDGALTIAQMTVQREIDNVVIAKAEAMRELDALFGKESL